MNNFLVEQSVYHQPLFKLKAQYHQPNHREIYFKVKIGFKESPHSSSKVYFREVIYTEFLEVENQNKISKVVLLFLTSPREHIKDCIQITDSYYSILRGMLMKIQGSILDSFIWEILTEEITFRLRNKPARIVEKLVERILPQKMVQTHLPTGIGISRCSQLK